MARDMPDLCKLPSLDSCQKMFLLTYKEVDLILRPVVGLVFLVGNACGSLDPFFVFSKSQRAGSMFHNHRRG